MSPTHRNFQVVRKTELFPKWKLLHLQFAYQKRRKTLRKRICVSCIIYKIGKQHLQKHIIVNKKTAHKGENGRRS